jgi:hypothetical protein
MKRYVVVLVPGAPPKKVEVDAADDNAVVEACRSAFGDANLTEHIPLYGAERFGLHLGLFVRDMPDPSTDRRNDLAIRIATYCHDRAFISHKYGDILGPALLYDDLGSVSDDSWTVLRQIIAAKRAKKPPPAVLRYWEARPAAALPPDHPSTELIVIQREHELHHYGTLV